MTHTKPSVVHNRGHGYSNRLYSAEVYYFTHMTRLARKPPDASENSILPMVCRPGKSRYGHFQQENPIELSPSTQDSEGT